MTIGPNLSFVRAPGVGLALVDLISGATQFGYPLEGGHSAAIALAAAIARKVYGMLGDTSASKDDLAQDLYIEWQMAGGTQVFGIARAIPTMEPRPVDASEVTFEAPHHVLNSAKIDWDAIAARLLDLGLTIETRAHQSALLSTNPVCSVFEIRDEDGKVLAEGKGLTDGAALQGALGEAVERLLAQTPQVGRLFTATARELASAGLASPDLFAGARDLYSDDLILEWVSAATLTGRMGALPAELVYYPYQPANGIRAFSVQHTAGLAAGATEWAATVAALREAIETDAYWLSMRSRQVCKTFGNLCDNPVPQIRRLVRTLSNMGIVTHAGLISFDWPLPVVHVVLETKTESLPALSHGLAAGTDPVVALERALLEAIQVHTGLEKVARQYWPEISVGLSRRSDPQLLWSDPVFAVHIVGMFKDAPHVDIGSVPTAKIQAADLIKWMLPNGMTPWRAVIGTQDGLTVVRVFIDGAVSPFSERAQPSQRVQKTINALGLRQPYLDPVLT